VKTVRTAVLSALLGLAGTTTLLASYYVPQYYTPYYTYSPSYGYYYTTYYYQVTVAQPVYYYHYCVYYPYQPHYVYYYNPVSQLYWGRYELGSKGERRYSMLAPQDRKKDLKDIPESAFPAPSAMPPIPGTQNGEAMLPPPENVPAQDK